MVVYPFLISCLSRVVAGTHLLAVRSGGQGRHHLVKLSVLHGHLEPLVQVLEVRELEERGGPQISPLAVDTVNLSSESSLRTWRWRRETATGKKQKNRRGFRFESHRHHMTLMLPCEFWFGGGGSSGSSTHAPFHFAGAVRSVNHTYLVGQRQRTRATFTSTATSVAFYLELSVW